MWRDTDRCNQRPNHGRGPDLFNAYDLGLRMIAFSVRRVAAQAGGCGSSHQLRRCSGDIPAGRAFGSAIGRTPLRLSGS